MSLRALEEAEQLIYAIENADRPIPPALCQQYEIAVAEVSAARRELNANKGLGVLPLFGWILSATGALTLVAAAVGITRGGYEVGEGVRRLAVGVRDVAGDLAKALRWALPIGVGVGAFMLARNMRR